MAITVNGSSGQSIRNFLEQVTNIESISLPNGEAITDGSSIKLVWEGSEYYLVEEFEATRTETREDKAYNITTPTIKVRNLDICLPMVIELSATEIEVESAGTNDGTDDGAEGTEDEGTEGEVTP